MLHQLFSPDDNVLLCPTDDDPKAAAEAAKAAAVTAEAVAAGKDNYNKIENLRVPFARPNKLKKYSKKQHFKNFLDIYFDLHWSLSRVK